MMTVTPYKTWGLVGKTTRKFCTSRKGIEKIYTLERET